MTNASNNSLFFNVLSMISQKLVELSRCLPLVKVDIDEDSLTYGAWSVDAATPLPPNDRLLRGNEFCRLRLDSMFPGARAAIDFGGQCVLPPDMVPLAIASGWGVPHPLAGNYSLGVI